MTKLFVWDFHGVLEKGNDEAVLTISNHILEKYGFSERFSKKDGERLTGQKWYQYFVDLLPHECDECHKQLQQACFTYSNENIELVASFVSLNDFAHEVLEDIHKSRHEQILISNTQMWALKKYLQIVGIEQYFSEGSYHGIDAHNNLLITKDQTLEMILLKKKHKGKVISIGDSPHDVALAKIGKSGTSFLYSHPGRPFRECEADYKIHDLREVLKEL